MPNINRFEKTKVLYQELKNGTGNKENMNEKLQKHK